MLTYARRHPTMWAPCWTSARRRPLLPAVRGHTYIYVTLFSPSLPQGEPPLSPPDTTIRLGRVIPRLGKAYEVCVLDHAVADTAPVVDTIVEPPPAVLPPPVPGAFC